VGHIFFNSGWAEVPVLYIQVHLLLLKYISIFMF